MSQGLTTNEIRSDINSESNVKDPKVGMTFPSWDAVDSYYHAYGKQRGFGVVREVVSYKQKAGRSTREKRAGLFDEREMWVPAYMRHLFWAGMKTTQRSESIHSFFDGYVNKTTRLCEFPQQYSYAMKVRANEEKEADANCWKHTRTLLTAFPFEAQFRDVYTDAKFKEVQVQCSRVLYVTPLEKRVVCDNVVEHLLEDIVYTRTKKKGKRLQR
ncbi:Protein FAR-RED ELONGATED HYPOCOTYL 3 [Bienertia sinuspersici]